MAQPKKQLLNNIIGGMARTRPNALCAVVPLSSTSYSEGFRKVIYSALANTVNGIAWWLTEQLGSGFGKDFPTICFMGWNDLRYVTMVLGAVKAGKTFKEAENEPLVCLHTSGTTGLPKPVIYSQDFVATYMRMAQLASPEGSESREKEYQGTRVFMNLPPFHARIKRKRTIRITSQSEHRRISSTHGTSYRLIASRDYETHTSRRTMCTSMDGARDRYQSRNLRRIGSPETRRYMIWRRRFATTSLEYRIFSDDQLYEAVIVRNSDTEFEQQVFKLYPALKVYSTKDLFSPHPTKKDLWTYRGRTGDMVLVVVDNVATRLFNPQIMEHAVTDHPDVKDEVMVPAGKFFVEKFVTETALLVDLKDSIDATALGYKERLTEEIWFIVDGINEKYREEAWVRKECIIITTPQKPLPRNPKGSI
ncbi:hypothetical protein BPOR_0348g00130 [Botrytis porri]|uniref:AMP-dependent synthetase/ligase domain-containing protein n=1 Tax=Botrytis porri TaxID=87229 RepID=A0A4Z1KK64_9HELO|nr:hypothetical protein BPOR_0348g00130 [Botrytis porri]